MQTKHLLNSYRDLLDRLSEYIERYEKEKAGLYGVSSTALTERVQTSRNLHKMESGIADLDCKMELCLKARRCMVRVYQYLQPRIMQLEYPYRDILYSRYIDGECLRKISDELGLVDRQIYHKHNVAVKTFESRFGDEYNHCKSLGQVLKRCSKKSQKK